MSIHFRGPAGAVETRWIYYALLRDNVQHHLESGEGGTKFPTLHEVASALGNDAVRVSAMRLRSEIEIAERELRTRPIEDLAVSARTRAALLLAWPPPPGPATSLARDAGFSVGAVPKSARTLGEVFGHLLDDLRTITNGAKSTDAVEVEDL